MSIVPTSIRPASAVLCRYPNRRCLHDISTMATTLLVVRQNPSGLEHRPSWPHWRQWSSVGRSHRSPYAWRHWYRYDRFSFAVGAITCSAANWSLVAWDPPGYGKSRPPQRTFRLNAPERDAQAASELMEALGYKRYSVMSWSGGGISGMHLTAQRPQVVRKLVTWGAPANISQHLANVIESKFYLYKLYPK